jgi:hypothetical protein
MLIASRFLQPFYLIAAVVLFSCKNTEPGKDKEGVEAALKQYDHLLKKLDGDSIALLYTADGDLGDKVHGRDSIRRYFASFKNVAVLFQMSASESVELKVNAAIQKGHYNQTALVDGKDTIKAKGEYMAYWLWTPKEGWRIRRMITKSL